jgi:hypothetical protein
MIVQHTLDDFYSHGYSTLPMVSGRLINDCTVFSMRRLLARDEARLNQVAWM